MQKGKESDLVAKGHCLEHSGHCAAIQNLKEDMEALKQSNTLAHKRIDNMKNIAIGILVALSLNLAGVIIILVTTLKK